MIRFFGIVLLGGVAFVWGNNHVDALRKKIFFLDAMAELIRYLHARIDYLSTPLDEIFASFHNDFMEHTGFSKVMRQRGMRVAILENSFLDEKERQFFLGFFDTLGSNCREEELKLCDYYLEELTVQLSGLKAEYPGKAKLWRILPLLGCLSLFLFLL